MARIERKNPTISNSSLVPPEGTATTDSDTILHGDVPGSQDNSVSDWLEYLAGQLNADGTEILDNALAIAEQRAVTRDLTAINYPGQWLPADDAKIVVTTAVPPQIRAITPAAGAWATATNSFTQTIPSNLRDTLVFVQLPVGASKSNYRVLRDNTGPENASATGTIEASRWSGLSSGITEDYPEGLYEEVFKGGLGSHWSQIRWAIQKHSEEVHETEYKGIFDGTFSDRVGKVISDPVDAVRTLAVANKDALDAIEPQDISEFIRGLDDTPATIPPVGSHVFIDGDHFEVTTRSGGLLASTVGHGQARSSGFDDDVFDDFQGVSLGGVQVAPQAGEWQHNPTFNGHPPVLAVGWSTPNQDATYSSDGTQDAFIKKTRTIYAVVAEDYYRTGFGNGTINFSGNNQSQLLVRTNGQHDSNAMTIDVDLYATSRHTLYGVGYIVFDVSEVNVDCTIKQHSDGTTGPSHYDCWLQIIMSDAETRNADLAYEFFAGFTRATGQANLRNFPSWQPDTTKRLTGHLATGYTQLHDSALSDIRTRIHEAEELLNQLNPLVGQLQNLRGELDVFSRRTGGIVFDNETSWKEVVDADGSTFGKFLIVPNGSDIDEYPNFDDYEDDKWKVEGITATARINNPGLVWVGVPEHLDVSKMRFTVENAAGDELWSFNGDTLFRYPSTQYLRIDNTPMGTVGYYTATNGDPLSQEPKPFGSVLWPGQRLVMENLSTTSTPVWTDELGDDLIQDLGIRDAQFFVRSTTPIEVTETPDPLVISSVLSDLHESAFHDVHSEPAAIPDDERFLVEALVRANRHGFLKPLRVEMDVDFYFQRAWLDTTSGEIQTMTVELHVKGKSTAVTLATVNNTRAEFAQVQSDHGSNVFDTTPSKTIHIDTMVDTSTWNLEDDDILQVVFAGTDFNGNARVRAEFRDLKITFTPAPLSGRGETQDIVGEAITGASGNTNVQTYSSAEVAGFNTDGGITSVAANGVMNFEYGSYVVQWMGQLACTGTRAWATMELLDTNGEVVARSDAAYLRGASNTFDLGFTIAMTIPADGSYRLNWRVQQGTVNVLASKFSILNV